MKYQESRLMMGTFIQLDLCWDEVSEQKRKAAYKAVWDRLAEIEAHMSKYVKESDVFQINASYQQEVTVHPDTYFLLQKSKEYYQSTDKVFDVTVGGVIALWKANEKEGKVPTERSLKAAVKKLGVSHFELLDNNRVMRTSQAVKIDLGGFAKGYAVDEVARIFREYGFDHFYIDAGGDLYVGGHNCQGEPWRIGVRDPKDKAQLVDMIAVSNQAVTTSGDYERYFEIKGERYSHIIDPRTGYPQKDVVSATVIAPTAIEADVLSTALCVLGKETGLALVDQKSQDHAAFIVEEVDSTIKYYYSDNYKNFQIQK